MNLTIKVNLHVGGEKGSYGLDLPALLLSLSCWYTEVELNQISLTSNAQPA